MKGAQVATVSLVGMRFRPLSDDVIRHLGPGYPVILRREPLNQFDGNAVQVFVNLPDDIRLKFTLDAAPFLLGYVKRDQARYAHGHSKGTLAFDSAGWPKIEI